MDNGHLRGPYTSPERDREQAVLLCLLLAAAARRTPAPPPRAAYAADGLVAAARVP